MHQERNQLQLLKLEVTHTQLVAEVAHEGPIDPRLQDPIDVKSEKHPQSKLDTPLKNPLDWVLVENLPDLETSGQGQPLCNYWEGIQLDKTFLVSPGDKEWLNDEVMKCYVMIQAASTDGRVAAFCTRWQTAMMAGRTCRQIREHFESRNTLRVGMWLLPCN